MIVIMNFLFKNNAKGAPTGKGDGGFERIFTQNQEEKKMAKQTLKQQLEDLQYLNKNLKKEIEAQSVILGKRNDTIELLQHDVKESKRKVEANDLKMCRIEEFIDDCVRINYPEFYGLFTEGVYSVSYNDGFKLLPPELKFLKLLKEKI